MLTVQKTREVRKKLPLHCYYAVIWQNILEEALDFQGSKSQILAFFLPYRLLVIFFLYVTSLEIMSNCVLYSYKLHSSSRTLLQDDDDFFFCQKVCCWQNPLSKLH